MESFTNSSCVIIYNPEKLLHLNDNHLSFDIFKEKFRNFINSEKIENNEYSYISTYMKDRISALVKKILIVDKIELDDIINWANLLTIYYVKNDEDIEKFLREKIKNISNNLYNKIEIKVIDLSDNNEILSDVPEWIKNKFDASEDIDTNVKLFNKNIYEIDNNFYLYAERKELEEIKNIVRLGKPFFVIGERGCGKTAIIQNVVKSFLKSQKKGNKSEKINCENFVPVACGTLLSDRAQSDLFGHTKEAYTGAIKNTKGYVGKANGGCLYLDEVQDLSKDIQRMLVKGIEEHKFYQVGSDEPYKSDFLLVCSSNKPLNEIKELMYEDFYDRISIFQIKIPSIEERKKDDAFISKCLPCVWKNYRKVCSNQTLFCEYDQLDQYDLPGSSIKEKMVEALKNIPLRGNYRDIQKLLAYIELYALNDETQLVKGKSEIKEINSNIDDAIKKWKDFITERNSLLPDYIPPTLTDDFIKTQTWKSLNKMFKSWIAEQSVSIYGSVNAAAANLDVDKNSIRNNLHKIEKE